MNYQSKLLSTTLVGALLAFSGACMADTVRIKAALSGASEVPATTSAGVGSVEGTLDTQTNLLSWTLTYSGLTGPAKAGHFHGPADAGKNAGVALGFTGSVESPITGTATLTPAQAQDLLAGKWYANLHTAANPGGEIRGQVTAAP
jgi:hypothetical protein